MTVSQKYKADRECHSAWLDVRDTRYHLLQWGNPQHPLLLMLHGWGDCAASFQFVVDALQNDWFVVAPDWRGFGLTQASSASFWFADYLADLDQILDHYCANVPATILGHSMGANVAALYAGVFPHRVTAFVNVEGFGLPDSDPDNAPANYRRWMTQLRTMPEYSGYASFEQLAALIRHKAPQMPADKALFVAENWAKQDDDGAVSLRADRAHKLPNAVLYRRAEAIACWRNISAPTLVVVGEDSGFAEAARHFPADESITLAECGHLVHFERPTELADATERFLRGLNLHVV